MKWREVRIYNASHTTTEIAPALLTTIRLSVNDSEKIVICNAVGMEDDILYIIINPAGLGSDHEMFTPKHFIAYQLDPYFLYERIHYKAFLSKALHVWDYSKKAVGLTDIKVTYFPIGFSSSMTTYPFFHQLYNEEEKDIDVLFLGYDIYEHRAKLRDNLIEAGLKTVFVWNLDINGMKDIIRRAKICINIHSQPNWYALETLRLNILLSNTSFVINEAIDDDEVKTYKDNILTVPYSFIVRTCKLYLGVPEKRKEQAIRSFKWYMKERKWEDLSGDLIRCSFE